MEFGLRAGINVSGLHGNFRDSMDANHKVGFHFGVYSKYYISDKFKVGFELLLTRKGFKSEYLDTFTFATIIYVENHYNLEVPLVLEYEFDKDASIELGASYGLILVNNKVNFPGISPFTESANDITAFLGMNYFIDELTSVGFRYSYGLNPIIETFSQKGYSSNFQVIIKSRLL